MSQVVDPLWVSLRNGDLSSFELVFNEYYASLFNYGCRLNKDSEEVKDCIQILFLQIWERKEHLGDSDNIRNYLFASLRRLIIKRIQSEKNIFVALDQENVAFYTDLSIEAKLIEHEANKEEIQALHLALEKLPARQREALFLRFFHNHSFPDIAEIMNISTRAVYKLIYKSLELLNRELLPKPKSVSYLLSLLF